MDELFDLPPAEPTTKEPEGRGRPRLQRPQRDQITLRPSDLESLLPDDHRARLVWAFVEGLDLSAFHARIKAVEGHSGRPPIDPAILVSLWLYATLEGVGSARALDRACAEHDAYRWFAGGVSVNYHTLADFRVEAAELLDALLVQSVAALLATGGVTLTRVAHDGIRVRAGAGAGSFRRRERLEQAFVDAEAQVRALRAELDDDPGATSRRVAAARERAATERAERAAGLSRRCRGSRPPSAATARRARRRRRPGPARPTPRPGSCGWATAAIARPTTASSPATSAVASSSGWPSRTAVPTRASSRRPSRTSNGGSAAESWPCLL